jgi:hypothetical protein
MQSLGCSYGQGYYYSQPIAGSDIADCIAAITQYAEREADSSPARARASGTRRRRGVRLGSSPA